MLNPPIVVGVDGHLPDPDYGLSIVVCHALAHCLMCRRRHARGSTTLARNRSVKSVTALAITVLIVCWVVDYSCGGVRPLVPRVSVA